MEFQLPTRLYTAEGDIRRVGFELEFGSITLEHAADIVLRLYGGNLKRTNRFQFLIEGTRLGNFDLGADTPFLKQEKLKRWLSKIGIPKNSRVYRPVDAALSLAAGTVVPLEISMPPLPMTEMAAVDELRFELLRHCASGTNKHFFAAYAMQINPEVPDDRADTLLSYLRAFFLLFDWLRAVGHVSLTRKLSPFIRDFPKAYVDKVLHPEYAPDIHQFSVDYLEANPTRNRPLDLLPLLTFINKDLVAKYPVQKRIIKARPTFHYRLPNSDMNNPQWNIAREWNRWIKVEDLASDSRRLTNMCHDYLATNDRMDWIKKTRTWLHARA